MHTASGDILTSNTVVNWVVYVASFVTAVTVICGFIWKILGPMVREEIRKMRDKLHEELTAEICEVKKQMLPNGGKSMYDALGRIEENQEELSKQFIQHLRDHMKAA